MNTRNTPAPAVKLPANREELRALIIDTRAKQADSVSLTADRDRVIAEATAAVEKKHGFASKLKELDDVIVANLAAIEKWAKANREAEFGKAMTIREGGAKIGFQSGRWSLQIGGTAEKEADNAKAVVKLLEGIIAKGEKEGASTKQVERADIARRYLRTKVELSKTDALKDREDKAAAKLLGEVGVTFAQGEETFVFEPLAS